MIDDLDFLGTEELNFKSIFLQVAQLVVYHQVVSNWCVCVCVCVPKWSYFEFLQSFPSNKSSFLSFGFVHFDLPIAGVNFATLRQSRISSISFRGFVWLLLSSC